MRNMEKVRGERRRWSESKLSVCVIEGKYFCCSLFMQVNSLSLLTLSFSLYLNPSILQKPVN